VALAPDKKLLAAGRAASIHLYSTDKGELVRSLVDPGLKDQQGKALNQSQSDLIEALVFSRDGKQLISGGFREAVVWDVAGGGIVKKFTDFADRVVALDISPDGGWLAAGGGIPSQDGEVKVIDLASGQTVLSLPSPHSDSVFGVRFSPDGSMLATCGADKFVKVWAIRHILRSELPATAVSSTAQLLSAATPGPVLTRQLGGLVRIHKTDWTVYAPGQQLKSFEGHTHHVLDVAWRGDGKVLVSAGADQVLKVWDFERGEQIRTIGGHGKQISRLAMPANGPMVFSACGDAGLRQANIDNGAIIRNFPGAADFLHAVSISGDGSLVAAGGEEGIVRLYNAQNGTLLKTLAPAASKK
jgi:WD40 repeat protein